MRTGAFAWHRNRCWFICGKTKIDERRMVLAVPSEHAIDGSVRATCRPESEFERAFCMGCDAWRQPSDFSDYGKCAQTGEVARWDEACQMFEPRD